MRVVPVTLLSVAAAAHAGTFGFVSGQGQGQVLDVRSPNGDQTTSSSLLLQENLGIHYAGLPFGPSVAMLGAGLEASNVNAFGPSGSLLSGRSATLDLSLGLLPRRALPVRLYVRGTVTDGGPQSLATLGGRESLAYGANVNLEPMASFLPGLRLDAEEHRFTGQGTLTPLGDVRRTLSATLYRSIFSQQLYANVRVEQEQRTTVGQWLGVNGTISWAGPTHQTTALASYLTRSLDLAGQGPGVGLVSGILPNGAGRSASSSCALCCWAARLLRCGGWASCVPTTPRGSSRATSACASSVSSLCPSTSASKRAAGRTSGAGSRAPSGPTRSTVPSRSRCRAKA
jgi:hypothetical protein